MLVRCAFALTLLVAACDETTAEPTDQETPVTTTQDAAAASAAVLETIERMTSAYNDGDIDTVMQTYEDGAIVLFEPGAPLGGTDALRAAFEGSLAIGPNFTFSEHEVFVAGDIAVHATPWRMTGTAPDGTAIEDTGLSIAILRRQANGEWLMVIDNPHGARLLDEPGYP